MGESMPTLEEWRRLYDAAIRVKGIAPWEWMTDKRSGDGAAAKAGDCGPP